MKKRYVSVLFLLMSVVTACDSGIGTASPKPTPAASPTPIAPTPTQPGQAESPLPEQGESPLSPTKTPAKPPTPSQTESMEEIKKKSVSFLAEELDISSEVVKVISIVPTEWPDASLGCPEPGKSYAQVVTEGYRVLLEAEGETHELHTDRTGGNVVICERAIDPAPAAAREYLADELGISTEEVNIKTVEPVEWSDASLGCPEPGKSYAQVVTPGYRILLEAKGKTYEVHTDEMGKNVVICEPDR